MKTTHLALAAAAMSAAAAVTAAPAAQAGPARTSHDCFYSSDWRGWSAPDDKTLYLRIRNRDVFRLDLAAKNREIKWSTNHIISRIQGSPLICGPVDLNLAISDGQFSTPLFVKAMTKLTPEEVAAIPKKYQP